MKRMSISINVAGKKRRERLDFDAGDAPAILTWLQAYRRLREATVYRDGRRTGRLRPMGDEEHRFWLVEQG